MLVELTTNPPSLVSIERQSDSSNKGPSKNDVTASGKRARILWQQYLTVLKSMTMRGGGVKNNQKERDIFYGWLLMVMTSCSGWLL